MTDSAHGAEQDAQAIVVTSRSIAAGGPPRFVHWILYNIPPTAVYAFDVDLGLKPGLSRADLVAAMRGHVIGQGELVAIYERKAP
jgi:phosphatidylethanolamine-binding protein (PEBP) family uncharacterized protein